LGVEREEECPMAISQKEGTTAGFLENARGAAQSGGEKAFNKKQGPKKKKHRGLPLKKERPRFGRQD